MSGNYLNCDTESGWWGCRLRSGSRHDERPGRTLFWAWSKFKVDYSRNCGQGHVQITQGLLNSRRDALYSSSAYHPNKVSTLLRTTSLAHCLHWGSQDMPKEGREEKRAVAAGLQGCSVMRASV